MVFTCLMESAEKESITVPKPDTRTEPAPYEETKANQMSPSEGLPYGCYLEGMKAGRQTGVQKRKARMCSAVPDIYKAAGVAVKHATTGSVVLARWNRLVEPRGWREEGG